MKRLALPAFAVAALGCTAAAGWREETGMDGVQYVRRVPQDGGGLIVDGWRNDGGSYIRDDLHSVANYSAEGRLAISVEAFRHREPDGVAAWTIADFWSWPADPAQAGVGLLCGYGPDMTNWSGDHARHVVAIVQWSQVPAGEETHHAGIVAAIEADLVAGRLTPVPVDDVYCHQELL